MKSNDELIADYIGKRRKISNLQNDSQQWDFPFCNGFYPTLETMKFKTSWDWIMPVIEKISKDYDINIKFYNGECTCYINKQTLESLEIASYGNFNPSIINVYKCIIEFLKKIKNEDR